MPQLTKNNELYGRVLWLLNSRVFLGSTLMFPIWTTTSFLGIVCFKLIVTILLAAAYLCTIECSYYYHIPSCSIVSFQWFHAQFSHEALIRWCIVRSLFRLWFFSLPALKYLYCCYCWLIHLESKITLLLWIAYEFLCLVHSFAPSSVE